MASSPLYGFGPLWGRGSSSTWGQGFLLQVQRKSREGRAVVMVALCVCAGRGATLTQQWRESAVLWQPLRLSRGGGVECLARKASRVRGAALLRTFATLKVVLPGEQALQGPLRGMP